MVSANTNYLTYLKVFTIFIVILNHSMVDWNWFKIFSNDFQMPLFMFVTGYVYYLTRVELGKYKTFNNLLYKKSKRLIIPFFLVSFIYYVPILLIINHERFRGQNYFQSIFQNILGMNVDYLWYVYALFIIFIVFYLGEKILTKFNLPKNSIIIITVLTCLNIISFKLPAVFTVNEVARYLLFFYLGYFVRSKNNIVASFIQNKKSKRLLIVLCAVTILIYFIDVKFIGNDNSFLITLGLLLLNVIKSTSILFVWYLLFRMLSFSYPNIERNKVVNYFGKETFSLYLYHRPIIYVVYFFLDSILSNEIVVLISFIVSTVFSLLISLVIRYVKRLNYFNQDSELAG